MYTLRSKTYFFFVLREAAENRIEWKKGGFYTYITGGFDFYFFIPLEAAKNRMKMWNGGTFFIQPAAGRVE